MNYTEARSPEELLQHMDRYITKDSGQREEFETGMVRDTQAGKPRFDLVIPEGVPYEGQMLTRIAELMARGAEKYGDRNWEKAATKEELSRARASVFRHFMQWFCGEDDEDHAAAVFFNIQEIELIKARLARKLQIDGLAQATTMEQVDFFLKNRP